MSYLCYLSCRPHDNFLVAALNLDAVDATGEQQVAVRHNIFKTRLDEHGREIDEANIAGDVIFS